MEVRRLLVGMGQSQEVRFPVLFHGRYEVHVARRAGLSYEQVGQSATFEVTADAPARVTLRP